MTKRGIKILLSARDPGAAGNILALKKYLENDRQFDARIVASGDALAFFQYNRLQAIPFTFNGSHFLRPGDDPSSLITETAKLLNQENPDLIITSISSFGIGIDEALIATSSIPTFSFQDFWGDANLGLGVVADKYFVLDKFAVDLSKKRWDIDAIVTGSPKYSLYKYKNISQIKEDTRKQIGFKSDYKAVGWFGQSPSIPGHEQVLDDFLKALSSLLENSSLKLCFILKEHPKFQEMHEVHLDKITKLGIKLYDVTNDQNVEKWLIAADLIITPFSLTGLDHAYLSSYSKEPIGSVIYLMNNDKIRSFAKQACGMDKFPIVDEGVGKFFSVNDTSLLAEAISDSVSPHETQKYFRQSKKIINKFDFKNFRELLLGLV